MTEDVALGVFKGILKIVKDKSPHEALNMDITECYQLLEMSQQIPCQTLNKRTEISFLFGTPTG